MIQNGRRGITSSSVVVRKKSVENVGGFPIGIHRSGDVDTWIGLDFEGNVGCVPWLLAVHHNELAGSSALFPKHVACHTWRLKNQYLVDYANDLTAYGDRREERRVLFHECSFRYCPPVRFAKALIRSARAGHRVS